MHDLSLIAWKHIYGLEDGMSVEEAALRTGVKQELAERAWRALGLPDRVGVGEHDLEMLRFFADMSDLLGPEEVVRLARVIGSSLARVAEAAASSTRVTLESPFLEQTPYVEFVKLAGPVITDLLPRLSHTMDRIFRYHLFRVSDQAWRVTPEGSAMTLDLAVGFADMVGFTERSSELTTGELTELIDRFEGSVTESIAAIGGRAVKFIGDEVMFTFADPYAACAYALQLVDLAEDDAIPDIRAGISCGDVISRYGDYYGPVVNQASRLVQIAPSGVVLVSAELAKRVGGAFELEAQPSRSVKGIDEPIEHFALRPS
jgi:adenylate cyclase